MARMHSRDKGKSGSTKPAEKVIPTWTRYKPDEVELLIGKLGKEGQTASQIGVFLRDTYGVPDVKLVCGKKISQILDQKELLHLFLVKDYLGLLHRSLWRRGDELSGHDLGNRDLRRLLKPEVAASDDAHDLSVLEDRDPGDGIAIHPLQG